MCYCSVLEGSARISVNAHGQAIGLIGDFFCWWGRLRVSGGALDGRILTALLYFRTIILLYLTESCSMGRLSRSNTTARLHCLIETY